MAWQPRRQRACPFCATQFWPNSPHHMYCNEWCQFWFQVDIGEAEECWPWIGKSTHRNGYGQFSRAAGECEKSHRAAYRLVHGGLLAEDVVCHHCDNPPCCNPGHVYAGTKQSNARDAIERGRFRANGIERGEAHAKAILTWEIVRAIRARHGAGERVADLAREFGVHYATASAVVHRRNWIEEEDDAVRNHHGTLEATGTISADAGVDASP